MSAAASIAWNGIVVEVLNRENYLDWSALVENYLKGNDLWYHIIEDKDKQQQQQQQQQQQNTRKENENEAEWENKNSRALHAIQLSCGKALGQIRNFKTAKEAWNHLKTSFSEDVKAHHVSGQTRLLDPSTRPLQNFMKKGFLEEAKLNINVAPRDIFSTSREDGRTALHMAVAAGHVELVKQLAETGKQRLLRMQDKKGYTALALAAKVTDNKEMAEWMVKYGGEELLTIAAKAEYDRGVDEIPVLLASAKGHKEMTGYLFNHTPWLLLRKNRWQNCVVLLSRCIYNEIFDVAVAILQDPIAREMPLRHPNKDLRPIYALAHMPDAFPSAGTKLHWLKRFIYHNILSLEDINNGRIQIIIHETNETERPRIMTHTLPALGGLLRRFQQFVQTSILLKFSVFQKIHEEKMNHHLVLEILNCLCRRISEMSDVNLSEMSAHDAMLQAAKNGITEFIRSMASENVELLLAMDESNRGIFAHAILNRQEEVFQLIHFIENINKEIFTSSEDTLGNNLLHIVAELGPPRSLDRISNAALQMQRELQWFQEVKNVMPPWCDGAKDANGKTASELFTNDHKELLKSAQEWAKETGQSFTIVGTLIITIMFGAAFTVPGGTDDKKGTPIFLGKDIFNFFIVSVAVSLVTSSSSVLMFIGILTSRYAEDDFLTNLPLKLLFGLVTLFFSVAFMMSAFCAALALLLEGYYRIIIAAMWLALLPILVSVPFLLRLTLEIFHSTVRFDKIAAKKKIKESWIQDVGGFIGFLCAILGSFMLGLLTIFTRIKVLGLSLRH